MATHKERLDRLDALLRAIPANGVKDSLPDTSQLLARLSVLYHGLQSEASRRRALQRDLEDLTRNGQIEIANPGGRPQRYRKLQLLEEDDPYVLKFARETLRVLIREVLPVGRLDRIWQHLLQEEPGFGLDESRLRIVPDTQRLQPAALRSGVLAAVVEAQARGLQLEAGYRDASNKYTEPKLHPQGLLQRGPRVYLYALKNDETEPVRMYALHRFTYARVQEDEARRAPHFSLDGAIAKGQADFAGGKMIDLELLARGWVADLLHDCPMTDNQTLEAQAETADFSVRVRATLPSSGQLLRWLLGCGDKVQVLQPAELCEVMRAQTLKMAKLYHAPPTPPPPTTQA